MCARQRDLGAGRCLARGDLRDTTQQLCLADPRRAFNDNDGVDTVSRSPHRVDQGGGQVMQIAAFDLTVLTIHRFADTETVAGVLLPDHPDTVPCS